MKVILFAMAVLSWMCVARAEDVSLEGHWFFYKKIYQGQEMPEPPDATLRMHFEFTANGESKLYWWHEGENDHCVRKGRYHVEETMLVDEINWVDPENTAACGNDPDMQLGRTTRTPFYFRDKDLAIRFHLDTEPLDLVWRKIEDAGKKKSGHSAQRWKLGLFSLSGFGFPF